MSSLEKAKQELLKCSKNYTYDDAKALLRKLGFEEKSKGKTSGSRVMFYRESDQRIILIHKPHSENTMDTGSVKDLIKCLKE
ncbi:MAG: type II toxin-antitoxin system HicA family toxin [Roseburia sp.]